MSLQIWFPFTGHSYNYGLNYNLLNNTVTFNNNGKLGKCLESTTTLNLNVPQSIYDVYTVSNTEISYCLWVKIDKAYLNNLISTTDFSTKTQIYNKIMGFDWGTTSNGIGLHLKTNTGLTQSTVLNTIFVYGHLRNGSASNGSTATEINLDQWYHLCVTYDKLNVFKFYINGSLIASKTINRANLNTTISNKTVVLNSKTCELTSSSSQNVHLLNLKEYINDVRIYDHALSPKEVEEIAKGLVLHYKLDGETQIMVPSGYQQLEYLESSGTQVINTNVLPEDTYQYKFKYALREFRQYRGPFTAYTSETANAIRIMALNGSSTNVYIEFNAKASGGSLQITNLTSATDQIIEGSLSKTQYTLKNLTTNTEFSRANSSDLFPTKGTALQNTMTLFGRVGYESKTRIYYFDTYNNGVCIQKLIPAKRLSDNTLGMYDIISHTFLTNVGTGTFIAGPNASITGLVYDSSGYSHNGTVIGSLTATTDSPRYGVATVFDGASYISSITPLVSETTTFRNEFSISAWIYRNDTNTVYSDIYCGPIEFYLHSDGQTLRMQWYHAVTNESSSSRNTWAPGTVVPLQEWTHVCCTFKDGVLRLYTNGAQVAINDRSSSGTKIKGNNGTHRVGFQQKTKLTDVRVYTTALTADQVKELYNTPMSIDSDGNIYARELVEL